MLNRSLIQLVRSVCTGRPIHMGMIQRIYTIKPVYFGERFYSNKSPCIKSSGCQSSSDRCRKKEPEPESDCGCQIPTSKYPSMPACCEEMKSKENECPVSDCPPTPCPTPCSPICERKEEPPKPPPKGNLMPIILGLALLIAIAVAAYIYHENQNSEPTDEAGENGEAGGVKPGDKPGKAGDKPGNTTGDDKK